MMIRYDEDDDDDDDDDFDDNNNNNNNRLCGLIVRVRVVPRRTAVGDINGRVRVVPYRD